METKQERTDRIYKLIEHANIVVEGQSLTHLIILKEAIEEELINRKYCKQEIKWNG